MPIRHKDLGKINFDRDAYSKDRPPGTWRATVDQTVWSQGSKTSSSQGGKRAGIHLYVQHEIGQKIWLFVPLLPGLASFATAAELVAGDIIEVEIASSKSGLSIVERLRKVESKLQLRGK